jgi:SAM-dependent methyltransferase
MERVVCDICRVDDMALLYTGSDRIFPVDTRVFSIERCNRCGLICVQPRPLAAQEIRALYPPEYDSVISVEGILKPIVERVLWAAEIRDLASRVPAGSHILEVGCSVGEYLAALRSAGFTHLSGVEYNPVSAEIARARHGFTIFTGSIAEAAFPAASIDAVIVRHVLEHVSSPLDMLCEIRRILKPKGVLFLSIPNIGSIDAALFKEYWYALDIPRHFNHFTLATLDMALAIAGLRRIRTAFSFVPNDWIMSTRNVLQSKKAPRFLVRFFHFNNPIALVMLLPFGCLAAFFRRSSRMRIVAVPM